MPSIKIKVKPSHVRAAEELEAIEQPADSPTALAEALEAEEKPVEEITPEVETVSDSESDSESETEEETVTVEHTEIAEASAKLDLLRAQYQKQIYEERAKAAAATKKADELEDVLRRITPVPPKAPKTKRAPAVVDFKSNLEFKAQASAAGYTVNGSSTIKQRGGPDTAHKKVQPDEVGTLVETYKNNYKSYLKMMQAKRDIAKSNGTLSLADYTTEWVKIK